MEDVSQHTTEKNRELRQHRDADVNRQKV